MAPSLFLFSGWRSATRAQDVIQFAPLGRAMLRLAATNADIVPAIVLQLGPGPLLDWYGGN